MRYAHIRFKTDADNYVNLVVPEDKAESYASTINWKAEIRSYETRKDAEEACEKQALMDDFGVVIRRTIAGRWSAVDPITEEGIAVAGTIQELRQRLASVVCVEGSGE